jgi:transcriptional regulator with XRE-family HTH domain
MTITRTEVTREAARRMRRFWLQNGEEIRRLREEAGVSIGVLADVAGIHKSFLARVESGLARPSIETLTAIGVALGADLSVRYYPGSGPRLYDRFQAPMVESLLGELDTRWTVRLEVPILRPSRGVIDLVLTDVLDSSIIACEVQSELRRLEQKIRWNTEKADGLATRLDETDPSGGPHPVSRLLVLRSTVATREIARQYEKTLATAYPARSRDVVLALTTSSVPWPGAGIVWMNLHGRNATLMGFPPRGVSLGR